MSPALVLIGIPGSGKTTVGALVAERLGLPLVDVAELVSDRLGGSAAEFFASTGEAVYREVETEVALEALAGEGVVALSSGSVASPEVRDALSGPVIWLQASVATVTRRLGMNSLGMATLVAMRDRLSVLAQQRAPWYAKVATAAIATDRSGQQDVADTVLGLVGGAG